MNFCYSGSTYIAVKWHIIFKLKELILFFFNFLKTQTGLKIKPHIRLLYRKEIFLIIIFFFYNLKSLIMEKEDVNHIVLIEIYLEIIPPNTRHYIGEGVGRGGSGWGTHVNPYL